jgi:hypothetical protein
MASTTLNYLLPYPEDSDPVDVAGDIRNLAEEVDEKILDLYSKVIVNISLDTYEVSENDLGKIIEMNSATSASVVIPPESSEPIPVYGKITIVSVGNGEIKIVPGFDVTINSIDSKTILSGKYAVVHIYKTSNNTWILYGDLS